MKYFTKELWVGAQDPKNSANHEAWDRALVEYREELKRMQSRVGAEEFNFFAEADVHDGELLRIAITDGSRPGPLSEPRRPWASPTHYPVGVELVVVDAYERHVWTIRYSKIKRVSVEFPGEAPMFYFDGAGFGDWGYHELTEVNSAFLKHEVLFSSGSVFLVEFGAVEVRQQARTEAGLTSQ